MIFPLFFPLYRILYSTIEKKGEENSVLSCSSPESVDQIFYFFIEARLSFHDPVLSRRGPNCELFAMYDDFFGDEGGCDDDRVRDRR